MTEPTERLRYKELKAELKARGISRYELQELIREKIIVGHSYRPHGRKFYHWSEIKIALQLENHNAAN